ncbi:hypothetical protein SAMN05892877_11797 [Rhizobium subbaraonis]|uniref:Uncharacterized protein n=1 Tax=Rhizobium subbaraonis TaxID=908946 RepID=A0A285UWH4_9HYPH|nr:hypothetical protein [Rhizobium subbaraonis]SOC45708.1 hypothetical protein SAMN05892877_11797 [Rhizobium subbaraonis]
MVDIVERLLTTPTARTWDSVGRAYDYPEHLPKEAAAEITRLRAEVEELRAVIAKPAIERAETRESLFPEMSARIAAERQQARAEAFERAAQIAEADEATAKRMAQHAPGQVDEVSGSQIIAMMCMARSIAAAIRQAASGESGTAPVETVESGDT